MTVTSTDANGETCSKPLVTQSGFSPMQFQGTILDFYTDAFFDGNTYLSIPIIAGSQSPMSLFIYPAMKVNAARQLNGQASNKLYSSAMVGFRRTPVHAALQTAVRRPLPAARPMGR